MPVVFKGDGVALVSSVGMLPAQKGFGEGEEGKSCSGSRWITQIPSWILLCKCDTDEGTGSQPQTNSASQPALGTFGLSLQLETSGDGRCRGHKEDVFISLFC